jgi:hypothetical protein
LYFVYCVVVVAASNATVRFPVEAFLGRIRKIAEDVAKLELGYNPSSSSSTSSSSSRGSEGSSSSSSSTKAGLSPQQALAAVERYLFGSAVHAVPSAVQAVPPAVQAVPPATAAFGAAAAEASSTSTQASQNYHHQQQQQQQEQQYTTSTGSSTSSTGGIRGYGFVLWPAGGRSALPPRTLVDHAGVWEDARAAYLNEVLVRKRGSAAALAIIYQEVKRGCKWWGLGWG